MVRLDVHSWVGQGKGTLYFLLKIGKLKIIINDFPGAVISEVRKCIILTFNLIPYLFYNMQSTFTCMISFNLMRNFRRNVPLLSFSDEGKSAFLLLIMC